MALAFWTVLIGAAVVAAGFFWGLAQVSEWILPLISRLAVLGVGVYAVGILPMSLVREWRVWLSGPALFIASVYGLGLWMLSFLLLWKWVGLLSAPAVLIAPLAAPLAVIGSVFRSEWDQAVVLLVAIFIARGMRVYAVWLAGRRGPGYGPGAGGRTGTRQADSDNVIETVVVETREDAPGDQPKRISNEGEFK